MGYKKIAIFLSFVILVGCQEKEIPYSVSDEKLVYIMSDIHISEAAVAQLNLEVKDSMSKVYLDQILTIHEVDKQVFETDFERLRKDPKKMEAIYTKIITRLGELKTNKKLEEKEENVQGKKKR